MKKTNAKWLMSLLLCGCLTMAAALSLAGNAADSARPVLDRLLHAIDANDYPAFVADGNDAFRAGMSRQMLQAVSAQFTPRLEKGYDASYLGELRQQGCQVHLWKLSFEDGGDDTLVKLVLKKGKVAGFWLQ